MPVTAEILSSTLDEHGLLCSRCSGIDFDEISQREISSELGEHVMELDSTEVLSFSPCPLCRLFGKSSPSNTSTGDMAHDHALSLRAFSSNVVFTWLLLDPDIFPDTILLGVVQVASADIVFDDDRAASRMLSSLKKTGFLCPVKAFGPARVFDVRFLEATHFDFNIARYWEQYCLNNHMKTCGKLSGPPIRSLRVIDCVTRKIVKAPLDCEYVALSYVWGSTSDATLEMSRKENENRPLPTLLKTLEDSIEVTRKLGLRYLWVDRYCIDQFDKVDKHRQIQQMDRIYAFAYMTIVAAAGQDPTYGLPGVNGTPRMHHQGILRVEDLLIVQTLPQPRASLFKSKWATRGWTFQEGILPRRRLMFTDYQVLFECNGMHCTESFELPLDAMHTKSRDRFHESVPPGSFTTKPSDNTSWAFMQLVSEYYQRSLSYPDDALNAFQGVLHACNHGTTGAANLSGINIVPVFHQGNVGTAKDMLLAGLFWYHRQGGERRAQFPSWSWIGWQSGKLSADLLAPANPCEKRLKRTDDPMVWIEEVGGHLQELPTCRYLPGYLSSIDSYARFIHIDAWTISCTIVFVPPRPLLYHGVDDLSPGMYAKYLVDDTNVSFAKIHLSLSIPKTCIPTHTVFQKPYVGILIPRSAHLISYVSQTPKAHVLVVEDKGEYISNVWVAAKLMES